MKKVIWFLSIIGILLPYTLTFYKEIETKYELSVLLDGVDTLDIPSKDSGYYYKDLTCNQENNAYWNNQTWQLEVNNIKNSLKCTIHFSKKTSSVSLVQTIINQEGVDTIRAKGTPDFTKIADTDEGLFIMEDDYGESYYYRGDVLDNNVYFANFYWKIIRINGDASIRLIYNGKKKDSKNDDSIIGFTSYNSYYLDNASVGYMFGNYKSVDYNSTHQNLFNSNVKNMVDNWYERNLKNYNINLSDTLFCNDRSTTNLGYNNNQTTYSSYDRVMNTKIPTLKCSQKNDRFTIYDTTIGNGNLTQPIGLITADEAMLAGIVRGSPNTNSYINKEIQHSFTTMTPGAYINVPTMKAEYASVWFINNNFANVNVNSIAAIRPVINLSASTKIVGGVGTMNNPYYVE